MAKLKEGPGWDVTAPRAWNDFWHRRFEAANGHPYELTHMVEIVRLLTPRIRSGEMSRVLDAGCGVHLEVKAFAALGMQSVGLDLSPTAIRFAQECGELANNEQRFFDEQDRRPGGTWAFVEGDILDPTVCAGPFDIVIARNVVQYYWHVERLAEMLDALERRLAPAGILVVTTHGMVHVHRVVADAIEQRGFKLVSIRADPEDLRAEATERIAVVSFSTG